jgi:Hypoxia induced protein conserved region
VEGKRVCILEVTFGYYSAKSQCGGSEVRNIAAASSSCGLLNQSRTGSINFSSVLSIPKSVNVGPQNRTNFGIGTLDRQPWCYVDKMASFLSTFVVPIAIAAVALVLLLGLINMMRGGSPSTSQKLMRWRVLLQFVAIVIIMITVWAMGHR